MFLIDSHCHLDYLDYKNKYKNIDDVIKESISNDVKFILTVTTMLSNFIKIKKQIKKYNNIALSCGIHPLYLNKNDDFNKLFYLASEDKVIAIGETGLDYYHQNENFELQQESFRKHIRIGCQLNKPIIIHARKAKKDILVILKEEKINNCGGVLHCFSEDKLMVKMLLDLGLYISFSGLITFNNTKEIYDAARIVPLDRILIETDAPYLTPVPHRGKKNNPSYLRYIAQFLAKIKGIDVEEIAQITTQNFCNLFHINI